MVTAWLPFPGDGEYTYVMEPVVAGRHEVYHVSSDVTMAVMAYGHSGQTEVAYGYQAGFSSKDS